MECSPRATKLCTTELILKPTVPYSQRSLSHAVLRLGTDSLVQLMNALKRKGRVWVGKKYIQDETWWLAKERTPEKGISGAVFILQRFTRSIEWHYLFRVISFYTWEVRPLRIVPYSQRSLSHAVLRLGTDSLFGWKSALKSLNH